MPSENGRPRNTVDELSRRLRSEMTPLDTKFSYFLAFPMAEEDLRQYLHDPVAALPAAVSELLPSVGIVLAPFLERSAAQGSTSRWAYEKPADAQIAAFSAHVESPSISRRLFFTVKEEQVSDYHYYLYDELAALLSHALAAEGAGALTTETVLREEPEQRSRTARWMKKPGT